MRITLHSDAGSWLEEITVSNSTLEAADSTGEPVILFPAPGERDMTTLRSIIEEAAHDDCESLLTRCSRCGWKHVGGTAAHDEAVGR